MSRQERTARRTRQAVAQAEAIVAEATDKVRTVTCRGCGAKGTREALRQAGHGRGCKASQSEAKPTERRVRTQVADKAGSGGSVDQATECKRLRDEQGMAWWLIGKTLGLPGAGDSATTGKSGAARARSLYRAANGGAPAPRTRAERTHNGNTRTPRHAGNSGSKLDRKLTLVEKGHVIPEDMEDEAVLAMIKGRTIEWAINLADLWEGPDHWMNMECRVHPVDCIMEEELCKRDGSRVVRFREFLGYDDDKRSATFGQALGGQTRTVRVNAIHTVR